jgi:pimeloyl-ACP methyl ester carboxylesterase
LHANEIGPILADEYGLHIVAPDPPGHGASPAGEADSFRPVQLAATAADLLSELGVDRAVFLGFSWGGRVGMWFAARSPERTTALVLVEGGHHSSGAPTGLEAAIEEARAEREEETFASWEDYFAYERESLRRWTPALEAAHRAVMREEGGRVAPVVSAQVVGAIHEGSRLEPLVEAYPAIAAARIPVLLAVSDGEDSEAVARFPAALPGARVESIPDAIHDLISFTPERIADLVGSFVAEHAS